MKKVSGIILALIMCLCCNISMITLAHDSSAIKDEAGLIDDDKEYELAGRMLNLGGKYNCTIAATTVKSFEGLPSSEYAEKYFNDNSFQCGENDCILLLVSESDRQYYIYTTGYGSKAFTEWGTDYIGDEIKKYLKKDDYYGAFNEFYSLCDDFLAEAEKGTPYDVNNKIKTTKDYLLLVCVAVGVGVIAALIVTGSIKSQLKTVRPPSAAQRYIQKDSLNMNVNTDHFLYKETKRRAKPQSTSASGSSGAAKGSGGSF